MLSPKIARFAIPPSIWRLRRQVAARLSRLPKRLVRDKWDPTQAIHSHPRAATYVPKLQPSYYENPSMASQYGTGKTRSETWRNQLSGLFQLIAEHVKEVDESALHTRLTTLLSLNDFASSLRAQLSTTFVQVLWAHDPDSALMKDRILAVLPDVPTFFTTRVDTLVPFLSSVYHFCSHDDFPLKNTIECLQQLIAIPRPVTP